MLIITMFVLIDPSVMGMSPQSVVAVAAALLLSVVLIRVIGADSGDVVVFCDDWPIVNGLSWKSPLSPSSVVISSFASPNSYKSFYFFIGMKKLNRRFCSLGFIM